MADLNTSPSKVATIEQTSKRLKLEIVLSVIVMFLGGSILWTAMSVEPPADTAAQSGGGLLFVGLIWYLSARLRRWWHHG